MLILSLAVWIVSKAESAPEAVDSEKDSRVAILRVAVSVESPKKTLVMPEPDILETKSVIPSLSMSPYAA